MVDIASIGGAVTSLTNIGTVIPFGITLNSRSVDVTGRTYETVVATAVPFDAIRVIMAVSQTAGLDAITPTIVGSVAACADLTDAGVSAASWTPVTVNQASSWTLPPAATAAVRRYVLSDLIPVSSVPRTDGGSLPLVAVRLFASVASGTGNMVVSGNGAIDFTNWETHPSGRIRRMRSKGGDFASANQSFMFPSNSAVVNGSPIYGIQYIARGKVVSVAAFGDSISEGQGGTYWGSGFGFDPCVELSTNPRGIAFEWSDLAWSGQSMARIGQNAIDAIAAGIVPDCAFVPAGSPNNYGSPNPVTITAAGLATMRAGLGVCLGALGSRRVEPIVWTWLPSDTAAEAYGATDALRVAYNNEVRARALRGDIIADFDAVIAGVAGTGGQIQIKVGRSADGTHLNDVGNADLKPLVKSAIMRAIGLPSGALIAA